MSRKSVISVAAISLGFTATIIAWRAEIFRAPRTLPSPSQPHTTLSRIALPSRDATLENYPQAAARLREWSQRAPREAWDWVRENSARLTPADEPSLIAVFFRHLAARDPDAVLAFANESLARADGAGIATSAIDALIENNWPALAQQQVERWATASEPPAIGAAPFQTVAWRIARDSDRAAADWLQQLPDSAGRNTALAGTAAHWAEHDPQAAMAWAAELSGEAVRADAMDGAFRIWADHDAVAAAGWLVEHESRPEADYMIGAWLANSPTTAENPRLALQWATLIRDESARRQSRELVLAKWRDRDAPAADRFAASSP